MKATIIIQIVTPLIAFFAGMCTERLRFCYQLRLANLSEAMRKCQEAHTLLEKLKSHLDNPNGFYELNKECFEWYTSNSLSLSESTRKAYYEACKRSAGIPALIGNTVGHERTANEWNAIQTADDAVKNAIEAVAMEHEKLSRTGTPVYIKRRK